MPNGGQFGGGSQQGDFLSMLQLPEIPVAGATVAMLGRMHACAAMLADFPITLPPAAGNTGKLVGVRITQASSFLVTIKGNGAELIDGINTRVMRNGESATLLCNGIGWTKISGKTIPLSAEITRTIDQLNLIGSFADNTILFDTVTYDDGGITDIANNAFLIKRSGNYVLSGSIEVYGNSFGAVLNRFIISGKVNATKFLIDEECNTQANQYVTPNFSRTVKLKANDIIKVIAQVDIIANTTDIAYSVANITEIAGW